MVFKAVRMNSWRQSKKSSGLFKERSRNLFSVPFSVIHILSLDECAGANLSCTQNSFKNFGHRTKSQNFLWKISFVGLLGVRSPSQATDINTILYNWSSLVCHHGLLHKLLLKLRIYRLLCSHGHGDLIKCSRLCHATRQVGSYRNGKIKNLLGLNHNHCKSQRERFW